jgi:competence protein ComEC
MYTYICTGLIVHTVCIALLQYTEAYAKNSALCSAIILGLSVILYVCNRTKYSIFFISISLAVCAASISVFLTTHKVSPGSIDYYAHKQKLQIRATICSAPDIRPLQTKYTLCTNAIIQDTKHIPVNGKVLFTDKSQWPQFAFGDTVEVYGVLEKPGMINETFAYDAYLQRYGIYSVLYTGSIKYIASSTEWYTILWRKILTIKQGFEAQINRSLPEPHASFMAGLLTGSRKGIPENVLEVFQITGLTHIIAISGYNITLIITLVTQLLFWLPKKYRTLPAAIMITLFTLFVGASAAVVRACIMGIIGLIALHTESINSARITMLWALCIMTSINPKYLWYDAGFQLSFLAVIGLIECSELLKPLVQKLPNALGIRDSLHMTLAAQITAAPFIAYAFGNISLISPIANILIAPFIPLAMAFGAVGTIISFAVWPIGHALQFCSWLCLEIIIQIATLLSNIPQATVTVHKELSATIAYYIGIVCIIVYVQKKQKNLKTLHPSI